MPVLASAVLLVVGSVLLPVGWWLVSRNFGRRAHAEDRAATHPGWKRAA
jgi:hypothetical protein